MTWRKLAVATVAVLATACTDHTRFIVVDIDAPDGSPDVVQIRIDAVVGNDVGTLVAPKSSGQAPLRWPESFSLEVPDAATGPAQLFVTAIDSSGCEAMATTTEFSVSTTRVSVTLAAVPTGLCLPAGTPIVRSVTSTTATAAASLSIAIPPGTAQDDVLIAVLTIQGGSNQTLASPADWSVLPNMDWMVGPTGTRTHAFWKVAGASEPPSYLFTKGSGNPTDINGMVVAVAGADSADPIEASDGQLNPPSPSCPSHSLTTTTDHVLLLYACAIEIGSLPTSSLPFAPPVGMSQLAAIQSAGTYKSGEETAWGAQATAGVTPQFAATSNLSNGNIGLLVAIRARTGL